MVYGKMDSKFPELRIGKEISIIGVLWYDRVRTRTKEEFLMRRRWEGAAVAGLALVVAMSMSLVSFAKEERTKVGDHWAYVRFRHTGRGIRRNGGCYAGQWGMLH